MTNKTLDLNKPVQTKCGLPARITYASTGGDYPIVALCKCKDGREFAFQCTKDGFHWANEYTLINVPEKVTKWVNIYHQHVMHNTQVEADLAASPNRLARIKIEYIEGEGL